MILNEVFNQIMPFCAAVSDTTSLSTLYIPRFIYTPGGSGSTFDKAPGAYGLDYDAEIAQTATGYSIDSFIETFDAPFPNHLKMDIDGVQDKVIKGAYQTLRDPRMKTAMLELHPVAEVIKSVSDDMIAAGFRLEKICPSAPGGPIDPMAAVTNHFYVRGQNTC